MKIFNTPITFLTATKLKMAIALSDKITDSWLIKEDTTTLAEKICSNEAVKLERIDFDINLIKPLPFTMEELDSSETVANPEHRPGNKYMNKSFELTVNGSTELLAYKPSKACVDYTIDGKVIDNKIIVDFSTMISNENPGEEQKNELHKRFKATFTKMEELRNEINDDAEMLNKFFRQKIEVLLEERKKRLTEKQAIDNSLESFI